jgi:hypothetical protein
VKSHIFILLLLVFITPILRAQQDTGKMTFAIKPSPVLFFSEHCNNNTMGISVDPNENTFSWELSGQKRKTVTIKAHTDWIDTMKSIITPAFINMILDCCQKHSYPQTTACGYYISIMESGKITFCVVLDKNYTKNRYCGSDRLQTLIDLLLRVYNEESTGIHKK